MQVKKNPEDLPVRYLKGVGPKKAELFSRLGIHSVQDLFYYLPRRYEDRSRIYQVEEVEPGQTRAVIGEILRMNTFRARTGTRIFEMAVGGGTRRIYAVWYNLPFVSRAFKVGDKVVLFGKIELQKRLQISHPDFEIIGKGGIAGSPDLGRIVPVYRLTDKLTQKYLRKTVFGAVKAHVASVRDPLPTSLRARRKLVDLKFAFENIHFPHSQENLERAYHRLVFEEFFMLQAAMAIKRRMNASGGASHRASRGLADEVQELLGFRFTDAQMRCVSEIEKDMSSSDTMYRLLQGDVGSGKTAVALYALLLAVKNGYQAVMMVPTEILARQHYVTVSEALMPLGVNVRMLASGMDAGDRAEIGGEISDGEADIVVGTHALLQGKVKFSNLGLVVVDEEHKFGVEQRKTLAGKGRAPDVLVMTATPIPRSLAMTVYGDMDVSVLSEKPAGRRPVTTYRLGEAEREAVYEFIRGEIAQGRQAFIVYPRVKEEGPSGLLSAEGMYERLSGEIFPDLNTAMVHGKMKASEKDRVMKDFIRGQHDILVATTVIEVGVDIPNVSVMVVEHAERYGLAQLHQLRGRIGRGKHDSYCILISEAGSDSAAERLDALVETDDGFEIAERDMDMRGPGELTGQRQSGLPDLKVGNIVSDLAVMEEARQEAFDLIGKDPRLEDPHNRYIKSLIVKRFIGFLKEARS